MVHVKQIRELIAAGKGAMAMEALDNLLSLGPNNVEALKLKAFLLEKQGRFREEGGIWEKLIQLDQDDVEANQYFERCFVEEREKFYFTDELSLGGRRFIAHSRSLVYASLFGLLGCLVFLLCSRYAQQYQVIATPLVSMSLFAVLVLLPWVAIIISYFKSLREVLVNREGLFVVTRTKTHVLRWEDVSQVFLVYQDGAASHDLSLLFMTKSEEHMPVEINVGKKTASIRAASLLIDEVTSLYGQPVSTSKDQLDLKDRSSLSF